MFVLLSVIDSRDDKRSRVFTIIIKFRTKEWVEFLSEGMYGCYIEVVRSREVGVWSAPQAATRSYCVWK